MSKWAAHKIMPNSKLKAPEPAAYITVGGQFEPGNRIVAAIFHHDGEYPDQIAQGIVDRHNAAEQRCTCHPLRSVARASRSGIVRCDRCGGVLSLDAPAPTTEPGTACPKCGEPYNDVSRDRGRCLPCGLDIPKPAIWRRPDTQCLKCGKDYAQADIDGGRCLGCGTSIVAEPAAEPGEFRLDADTVRRLTEGLATAISNIDQEGYPGIGETIELLEGLRALLPDFDHPPEPKTIGIDRGGISQVVAVLLDTTKSPPEVLATRVVHSEPEPPLKFQRIEDNSTKAAAAMLDAHTRAMHVTALAEREAFCQKFIDAADAVARFAAERDCTVPRVPVPGEHLMELLRANRNFRERVLGTLPDARAARQTSNMHGPGTTRLEQAVQDLKVEPDPFEPR